MLRRYALPLVLFSFACDDSPDRPSGTRSDANTSTTARDSQVADVLERGDADPLDIMSFDSEPLDADQLDADPLDGGDAGCTLSPSSCVCAGGNARESTCFGVTLNVCMSRFDAPVCQCMGGGSTSACGFDCFQSAPFTAACCEEPTILEAGSPIFSTTAMTFTPRAGCLATGATITRIKSLIPGQGVWDSYNPISEQWTPDGNGQRYMLSTNSIDETVIDDIDPTAGWFMVVEIGNRAFALADGVTVEITPDTFPGAVDPTQIPTAILNATFAFR